MDSQPTSWAPIGATFVTRRARWFVLYARYTEDGWEYSQRVLDPRDVEKQLSRGETAPPPDPLDD